MYDRWVPETWMEAALYRQTSPHHPVDLWTEVVLTRIACPINWPAAMLTTRDPDRGIK